MGQDGAASAAGTTWRLELSVPPDLSALAAVRRSLDAFGLPPGVREDAKLLVTELVSNSIRHAGLRAGERIRIWAVWSGRRLKVVVRDRDHSQPGKPGQPSGIAESIRPVPGAESGWGLFIVNQLATRWGAIHDGSPGYWFELDASPPSGRGQNEERGSSSSAIAAGVPSRFRTTTNRSSARTGSSTSGETCE